MISYRAESTKTHLELTYIYQQVFVGFLPLFGNSSIQILSRQYFAMPLTSKTTVYQWAKAGVGKILEYVKSGKRGCLIWTRLFFIRHDLWLPFDNHDILSWEIDFFFTITLFCILDKQMQDIISFP